MDRRQNTYVMDKGFKGRVSNHDVPLGRLRKIKNANLQLPGFLLYTKLRISSPLPKKVKDHNLERLQSPRRNNHNNNDFIF